MGSLGLIGFGFAGADQRDPAPVFPIRPVLSLLLMGGGQLMGVEEYIPFLLLGGSILVAGALLLTRFVRRYPIAIEES